MPRTLWSRSGSPPVTWAATAGRVALAVLFGLGVLVPSLGWFAPVAAQATSVSFSTAEAAPADSIAYLVMTLNDESEQWRLADVLLDRAGLGEALDEEIGSELRDEAGEDLPLDAFLGGEVGIVVSPTVLETLAEESMGLPISKRCLAAWRRRRRRRSRPRTRRKGSPWRWRPARRIRRGRASGTRSSMRTSTRSRRTKGPRFSMPHRRPPDDEGMAAARVGDLILIATTPEDLHPLIDTADGRTPGDHQRAGVHRRSR